MFLRALKKTASKLLNYGKCVKRSTVIIAECNEVKGKLNVMAVVSVLEPELDLTYSDANKKKNKQQLSFIYFLIFGFSSFP